MIRPPNMIEIELVRGCNLNCDFCGNYSLPAEKKFITIAMAKSIAMQVSVFPKARIDFVGRGEPTLHPDLMLITHIFRKYNPKTQFNIMSNGVIVDGQMIKDWFNVGGNFFIIDCYNKKVKSRMVQYRELKSMNKKCNVWNSNTGNKHHEVIWVEDIKDDKAKTRQMNSRCGTVNPAVYDKYGIDVSHLPLEKKCVKPFRHLMIHYDGTVPLCCMDWMPMVKMYDMRYNDLHGYWFHNAQLMEARKRLYNRDRKFLPCSRCDYIGGFYIGSLPNMNIKEDGK